MKTWPWNIFSRTIVAMHCLDARSNASLGICFHKTLLNRLGMEMFWWWCRAQIADVASNQSDMHTHDHNFQLCICTASHQCESDGEKNDEKMEERRRLFVRKGLGTIPAYEPAAMYSFQMFFRMFHIYKAFGEQKYIWNYYNFQFSGRQE